MILPDLKRTKGRGPRRFRDTFVLLSMTPTTAAVEALVSGEAGSV